jgi:hypothetical protein
VDLGKILSKQLLEASELLKEIEHKSTKKLNMVSKFYEKICAILPNNLLSKIKESNEKLTDTYNKMTNYYNNIRIIKRTSSSDKEGGKKMILQINKVDDIPATLI